MNKLKHINKMASLYRHATLLTNINHNLFICILLSLALPTAREGAARTYDDRPNIDDGGRRLTREYHLRQGALRGLIVKPSRQYDLQNVEVFFGIPYAAPPIGHLRFMPPVSAIPWPGVKMATHHPPVCPQMLPTVKKGNPPSLGRQHYMGRLKPFLRNESEDCLYLNIYVPYREQKTKKFPILVFIHGDSFEWSSGNPYDGRILASYGNIMVITVNFRLGVLGFMKPSLTEHVYGNNGLLDQLAALQWIKDNIEDLNGDPASVTLMGHGTGAACVNFLMLSPILSNGLFHRAILMSGSALSDWALTKNPAQYTMQVAQSLSCNPNSAEIMTCLQNKSLSEIKKAQILAREFETPLGPVVAGSFIPNEPAKTMESYPNLLNKYQLLSGVTEFESYHEFGVIELVHGILENQRDDFVKKYLKLVFDAGEDVGLKDILKQYSLQKGDPQRWSVENNREFILNVFSDSRTVAPLIKSVEYQSKANPRSYLYVFGHNSESTEYAALHKSVHGEEMPYVLGVPLGGAVTHFHAEYTLKEKLLSEAVMRLWTNFVKNGSPNTQSSRTNSKNNEYYTLDRSEWRHYNIDWPEYNIEHQSFLRLDIPPFVSSFYRSNYTRFWTDTLPNKMKRYIVDPLFEFTPVHTTQRPKTNHRNYDTGRRNWNQPVVETPHRSQSSYYGKVRSYSPPANQDNSDVLYREIQSIKHPSRAVPSGVIEKSTTRAPFSEPTSEKTDKIPIKTSSTTVTVVIVVGLLFLLANIAVCTMLYFKRRKINLRQMVLETDRCPGNESREKDNTKTQKEDKSAMKTFKNSYSALRSMGFKKVRSNSKIDKPKVEPCKTPKSDDSGGFGERFRLRRHLSTSTLDANTKVRDWITNDVMHRCSPNVLRKSNSDICNNKFLIPHKPYTRSEELLSEINRTKKILKPSAYDDLKLNLNAKKAGDHKIKTSEKTTSTSALGSHSSIKTKQSISINSIKQNTKSNDSLKSSESKKVSIAIDATPGARTNSILQQEPIEVSKSFEYENSTHKHAVSDSIRSNTDQNFKEPVIEQIKTKEILEDKSKTFTSVINLSLKEEISKNPLKISHKHSTSDPVTDINYDEIIKNKNFATTNISNIPPPALFGNDVNVTSKDERTHAPLSPAEALLTIKRRNFPKVLPDFPASQKRLSLQPNCHTFRSYIGSVDNPSDTRSKIPPQPPPRTTTLERRLAEKNSKILSSFDSSSSILRDNCSNQNYENIDNLSSIQNSQQVMEKIKEDYDKPKLTTFPKERDFPKVIIASSDGPNDPKSKIVIAATHQQCPMELPTHIPRVTLPDNFHSQDIDSTKSYSSIYSDDDDVDMLEDEFLDDIADDKLIQELVGGVDSPTNSNEVLDSKGPDTDLEKKLEIVPVKINTNTNQTRNEDDYIFISDLMLPDACNIERTAQIKPHFSLNKLLQRSESIQRPLEKAVKVKQKRNINPSTLLSRNIKPKDWKKCASNRYEGQLQHSNSGSSNDTEASTGTVKKFVPK